MPSILKLAISVLLVAPQVSLSNETSNLQGYYKSKASLNYSIKKIEQNKIDFVILDEALSRLNPSAAPQPLASLAQALDSVGYSVDQKLQATALYQELNPESEDYACVVAASENNAKIVFLVDEDTTSCSQAPETASKAISLLNGSRYTTLSFYRKFGNDTSAQYYIEQLEKDDDGSEAIITRFITDYSNAKTVELAKVDKNVSGSFMVEHFSDYGTPTTDTVGTRSYQWTAYPIRENSDALINSFSYFYGPNASLEGKNNSPHYWANKESVSASTLASGKVLYFATHVEQALVSPDNIESTESYTRFRYSAEGRSDWLAYNFNNANNLVGLSPDECMIYSIRNQDPVIRYQGYNRTQANCTEEIANFERIELTQLTKDNNQVISVTDSNLILSASEIIEAIESHDDSANSSVIITKDNMLSMKNQYDKAVEKYKEATSLKFWQ